MAPWTHWLHCKYINRIDAVTASEHPESRGRYSIVRVFFSVDAFHQAFLVSPPRVFHVKIPRILTPDATVFGVRRPLVPTEDGHPHFPGRGGGDAASQGKVFACQFSHLITCISYPPPEMEKEILGSHSQSHHNRLAALTRCTHILCTLVALDPRPLRIPSIPARPRT